MAGAASANYYNQNYGLAGPTCCECCDREKKLSERKKIPKSNNITHSNKKNKNINRGIKQNRNYR